MKKLAKRYDGKFLSKAYLGSKTKLKWKCEKGHIFWKAPGVIKSQGQWCPKCALEKSKNPKKYDIEYLQNIAIDRGGWCLSPEYLGLNVKLWWQCGEGHVWKARPSGILYANNWCPYCAGLVKKTIEDMHILAKQNNGVCLSKGYINSRTKLNWQCKKGHKFSMTSIQVQRGHWCPVCAKDVRSRKKMEKTFQKVKKIAEKKGGVCLSNDYVKHNEKLRFRCKYGHEWIATPRQIVQGHWCRQCFFDTRIDYSKYSIEDMRRYAESKGGECLSTEYKGFSHPLEWRCSHGHVWKAKPVIIILDAWCRKCAAVERGKKRRLPIAKMHELARNRGGKLLSTKYINEHTKLKWQCSEGHIFEQTPSHIMYMNSWCPICSQGISERICREYFKFIFRKEFPKKRPRWLLSNNKSRMELDGYNEELDLAFEYHGEQHFSPITLYGSNKAFKERQQRDKLKKNLCLKNNVVLIEIPYTVKYNQIQSFILKECRKKGVKVPKQILPIDYVSLDIHSPKYMQELQKIANEHGGKCLSKRYIDSATPLKWKCSEGHIWEAPPARIKMGHWCPKCVGVQKLNITIMQEWAVKRDGECLSKRYKGNKTKLKWKCNRNHVFWMKPNSVQQGSWCPTCATRRTKKKISGNIEDILKIAESKGGKCLSNEYENYNTIMKFQCREGHIWDTRAGNVKRGYWCPYCAGVAKGTIEEMQKIAKERHGKCLSARYINNRTKLKWECEKKHQWEATPELIKRGSWCPYCSHKYLSIKEKNCKK